MKYTRLSLGSRRDLALGLVPTRAFYVPYLPEKCCKCLLWRAPRWQSRCFNVSPPLRFRFFRCVKHLVATNNVGHHPSSCRRWLNLHANTANTAVLPMNRLFINIAACDPSKAPPIPLPSKRQPDIKQSFPTPDCSQVVELGRYLFQKNQETPTFCLIQDAVANFRGKRFCASQCCNRF